MGVQAKEQLLAKWQRKKRHLTDTQRAVMQQAGVSPEDFGAWLKQQNVKDLAEWFTHNPDLGELLDRKRDFPANPVVIAPHQDTLIAVDPHYGKPEDYLEKFALFIKDKGNTLPALLAVVQRPRELTRKDLVQLITVLDGQGFDEKSLTSAWAQTTSHEIAARLLGFVRQAALGDALIPFDRRVDAGVQRLAQRHAFTPLQKDWLKKLASQVKANVVLDETLINEGPFREQGGFKRLNQIFDGKLPGVLADLNEAIWQEQSACQNPPPLWERAHCVNPGHTTLVHERQCRYRRQTVDNIIETQPPDHPHHRHRCQALEPVPPVARRRRHLSPVRHRADLSAVSEDGEGNRL